MYAPAVAAMQGRKIFRPCGMSFLRGRVLVVRMCLDRLSRGGKWKINRLLEEKSGRSRLPVIRLQTKNGQSGIDSSFSLPFDS